MPTAELKVLSLAVTGAADFFGGINVLGEGSPGDYLTPDLLDDTGSLRLTFTTGQGNAEVEALTLPAGATVTAIRWWIYASAADAAQPCRLRIANVLYANTGADIILTEEDTNSVYTGAFTESDYTAAGVTMAELVDIMQAATVAWQVTMPVDLGSFRIYEARILVDYNVGTHQRVHPRQDGLGTSTVPRIWPPPRSVQGSNRLGGGTYF